MCLVENDGVVLVQEPVALGLGQQDAVGHELDQRGLGHLFDKAHLETDQCAHRGPEFIGDPARNAARGNASRLGATDQAINTATCSQRQQGQLRGLARSGLASNHHDLVLAYGIDDRGAFTRNRQAVVKPDFRHGLGARSTFRSACIHRRDQRGHTCRGGRILASTQLIDASPQCRAITPKHLAKARAQGANIGALRLLRVMWLDRVHPEIHFNRQFGPRSLTARDQETVMAAFTLGMDLAGAGHG